MTINLFLLGGLRCNVLAFDCWWTSWRLQRIIITIIIVIIVHCPSWRLVWRHRHRIKPRQSPQFFKTKPKTRSKFDPWTLLNPLKCTQGKYTCTWTCACPCIILTLTARDLQSSIAKYQKVFIYTVLLILFDLMLWNRQLPWDYTHWHSDVSSGAAKSVSRHCHENAGEFQNTHK